MYLLVSVSSMAGNTCALYFGLHTQLTGGEACQDNSTGSTQAAQRSRARQASTHQYLKNVKHVKHVMHQLLWTQHQGNKILDWCMYCTVFRELQLIVGHN